jgi:hypothetical protein
MHMLSSGHPRAYVRGGRYRRGGSGFCGDWVRKDRGLYFIAYGDSRNPESAVDNPFDNALAISK